MTAEVFAVQAKYRRKPTGISVLIMPKKIRDCIRIAALLRERVLRFAFDCKKPRDAEFTLT
jgi:hypothetical protein